MHEDLLLKGTEMIATTTQTDEMIIFRQAVFVKSASTQTEGDLLLGRSVSKATQTLEYLFLKHFKQNRKLDYLRNDNLMSQEGTCDEDNSLRNNWSSFIGQDSLSDDGGDEEFGKIKEFGLDDAISNGSLTDNENINSDFDNEAIESEYQEKDRITTIGKDMNETKKSDSLKRNTNVGKTEHRHSARRSESTLTNNIMLQSGVNCQLNLMQLGEKSGAKPSEIGCTKSQTEESTSIDNENFNQNRGLVQASETTQLTMTHLRNIKSQCIPDVENKNIGFLSDQRFNNLNRNVEETSEEMLDMVDGRANSGVSLLPEKTIETLLLSCVKSSPTDLAKESSDSRGKTPFVQKQITDINIQDDQQITIEHEKPDKDKVRKTSKTSSGQRIQMFMKKDKVMQEQDNKEFSSNNDYDQMIEENTYAVTHCESKEEVKQGSSISDMSKNDAKGDDIINIFYSGQDGGSKYSTKIPLNHYYYKKGKRKKTGIKANNDTEDKITDRETSRRSKRIFKNLDICGKSENKEPSDMMDDLNINSVIGKGKKVQSKLSKTRSKQKLVKNENNDNIMNCQCEFCGEFFTSQTFLDKHKKHKHFGKKTWKCDTCNREFKSHKNLKTHVQCHTREAKYECSVCNKKYVMEYKMRQHMGSHGKVKPYICKYCDKEFKAKVAFQEHELKHVVPPENLLTVPCTVCGKKYQNLSKVKVHYQRVHSAEALRFKCEYCDKTFSLKGNMKTHMRTHTGEKPFKCRFCYKSFSLKCTLLEHENRHQGIKLFPCDVCEMSFVNKSALRLHKISHSGIKRFQCEVCGDQLATQTNLKVHMRIHTGEKPYTCHHCAKSFRTQFVLNKHIRSHTGEKLPAKYPCDICGKKFITSYNRKIHRMNHTGEKPFICEICGQKFQTQGFLNTHLKKCLENCDREYDNSVVCIQNY